MTPSSLNDWLRRLESLHPAEIELGLERVGAVATRLACQDLPCPVITIAGTNGKGSAAFAAEAFAGARGAVVGCYTSPHLLRYNERIRIAGREASDQDIVAAFREVEEARHSVPLTWFEFGTLAALLLFQRARLDLAVLEVGLGGRLDAVNIVDPDIAVITAIALDHEAWLGNDVDSIALEKAGIMRQSRPVVLADGGAPRVLAERAGDLGCPVLRPGAAVLEAFAGASRLRPDNLAAAWLACGQVERAPSLVEAQAIANRLQVPGRMQSARYRGANLLLDVAHNPAAAACLATQLRHFLQGGKSAIALFAALSDKDIRAMIRACRGCFAAWLVPELPGVPRALSARSIADILAEEGERVQSQGLHPAAALEAALGGMRGDQTLVVFGSFYTVSAVLRELGDGGPE